jgi:hypothetical protein
MVGRGFLKPDMEKLRTDTPKAGLGKTRFKKKPAMWVFFVGFFVFCFFIYKPKRESF